MRYTIAVILILLSMMVSVTYAQTDSVQAKIPLMINTENSKSLEFQPWQDVSISYKHQLTRHSALRHTLDISFNLKNTNDDVTPNSYSVSSKQDDERIALSSQYLTYPLTLSLMQVFLGAGPLLSLSRYHYFSDYGPTAEKNEQTDYRYSVGVVGIVGLECFLTDKFSLLAQYRLSTNYTWYENEHINKPPSGYPEKISIYKSHSWSIGLNSVSLGIAYYF